MTVKIKKKIKRLFALVTACIMAVMLLPAGVGLSAEGASVVLDGNTFITGTDNSATIKQSGSNTYLNISPVIDGRAAFAELALDCGDNTPIELSYRFKINDYKLDGQTVAYISKGGVPSIIIETRENMLVYKNKYGNYVPLLNSYQVNRWYSMVITADYSKKTFSIKIDAADKAIGAENIGGAIGADSISFSAKYAPGIAIDDFSANCQLQLPADIEFSGENEISLQENSSGSAKLLVNVFDTNGVKITNPNIRCEVLPNDANITVSLAGSTATLNIPAEAAAGEYQLRVTTSNNIARSFLFSLKRYSAEITSVVVEGDGRVAFLDKKTQYQYTAKALDQNGNEIKGAAFTYILAGDNVPSAVSIDSISGLLTVSSPLPDNTRIKVQAECTDNPGLYGEKNILLQDALTYEGDQTRFQILLDYIDRARALGRDPYNGSILLAKAIDRYTMKPAIWRGLEYDFVPSNLAEQGNWFRTMQGLYNLTGDAQYKREIDETYDMYLENYVYDNGTMSLGGHICIDLQTLLPHHGYNSNTLELKSHFPYFDPFWEKDPETARKFAIMFWEGAVTNWKKLAFNRHIKVYDPYTEANWKNLDNLWEEPSHLGLNPVASNGVSFRSTASDLVSMGVQLYKSTGEVPALEWPRRVLYMYYAATDTKTKLATNMFNSRYYYKNNEGWGYDADLTVPDYWWMKPGLLTSNDLSDYGDRFDVQVYQDMVDKGYIKAVNRRNGAEIPMSLEPFFRNMLDPDELPAYADLELAEAFGFDSEEGKMILDYTLTSLQSLYTYGNYSVTDNKVDPLLVDGTSLNGYVAGRYGYYMSKGSVLERMSIDADFTVSNLKTYFKCKDLKDFSDQLYYVWQFIRGDMAYNGFGEVGITEPGDSVKLDFSATSSDPRYILAFCWLYDETGVADYLDMARHIANNVVESNMVEGMFTYQPSSHYIEIAGRNGIYPYAFALLEATVRGETDLIPQYYVYHGYYEDRGILENTNERRTNLHDDSMWNRYNVTAVHITDIIVPEEEITMKVNEEKFVEISFEPDDATNKSVTITSSDPAIIAVDEGTKCLYAKKKGSAQIRIVSTNNRLLRKTIDVTVE